jgi:hypothetical protein
MLYFLLVWLLVICNQQWEVYKINEKWEFQRNDMLSLSHDRHIYWLLESVSLLRCWISYSFFFFGNPHFFRHTKKSEKKTTQRDALFCRLSNNIIIMEINLDCGSWAATWTTLSKFQQLMVTIELSRFYYSRTLRFTDRKREIWIFIMNSLTESFHQQKLYFIFTHDWTI